MGGQNQRDVLRTDGGNRAERRAGDDSSSPLHAGADSGDSPISVAPCRTRVGLNTLPGAIPLLEQLPIGCRLGPRCPYAQRECIETPRLVGARNHLYACHFPLNMEKE